MSTSPFAHYAEEVAILTEYAHPIVPRDRPLFYEMVSELLRGVEVGPGSYARACASAQKEFLIAPAIDEPATMRPSRPQVPRGPFRRRA